MAIHWYLWIAMDICGYPWIPMEIHDVHGYAWISMVIHWSIDSHGSFNGLSLGNMHYLRKFMDYPRISMDYAWIPKAYPWIYIANPWICYRLWCCFFEMVLLTLWVVFVWHFFEMSTLLEDAGINQRSFQARYFMLSPRLFGIRWVDPGSIWDRFNEFWKILVSEGLSEPIELRMIKADPTELRLMLYHEA